MHSDNNYLCSELYQPHPRRTEWRPVPCRQLVRAALKHAARLASVSTPNPYWSCYASTSPMPSSLAAARHRPALPKAPLIIFLDKSTTSLAAIRRGRMVVVVSRSLTQRFDSD